MPRTTTPPPTFEVGDGATLCLYTDRYACTVVAVSPNGKTITLRRDKATLLNGFESGEPDALVFSPGGFMGHTSGVQRYSYEPNPDGQEFKASLRKNGQWVRCGHATTSPGNRVTAGRHERYDYNF